MLLHLVQQVISFQLLVSPQWRTALGNICFEKIRTAWLRRRNPNLRSLNKWSLWATLKSLVPRGCLNHLVHATTTSGPLANSYGTAKQPEGHGRIWGAIELVYSRNAVWTSVKILAYFTNEYEHWLKMLDQPLHIMRRTRNSQNSLERYHWCIMWCFAVVDVLLNHGESPTIFVNQPCSLINNQSPQLGESQTISSSTTSSSTIPCLTQPPVYPTTLLNHGCLLFVARGPYITTTTTSHSSPEKTEARWTWQPWLGPVLRKHLQR